MARLKIKLNSAGVRELLKSQEIRNVVETEAAKKARQAGEGYSSEIHVGQKRLYANIFPETRKAVRDNFENNTLEKVIRS